VQLGKSRNRNSYLPEQASGQQGRVSVFISRPFQPTTYYFNLGRFDKALAISSVKGITVLFFSPEISTSVCR